MGNLKFLLDIDGKNAIDTLDKAKDKAHDLADTMRSFQDEGADISSTAKQIEAVQEAMVHNAEETEKATEKLNEFRDAAEQAFAKGDMDEFERQVTNMENQSSVVAQLNNEYKLLKDTLETLDPPLKEVNTTVEKQGDIMTRMLGGAENYKAIMAAMPKEVQKAAKGIQAMTKAGLAFIATPLGAALAAIVLALKAVRTWMNSTVEGQMALAKASGVLKGVLGQLKEIVINVGKALYELFTNPIQKAKDFGNAIKSQIMTRFESMADVVKGLGSALSNLFKGDFAAVKEDINSVKESFVDMVTGVEDSTTKFKNGVQALKDYATTFKDNVNTNAALAVRERQLEQDEANWVIERQQLETQKQEARANMYNTNISAAERKKALEAYKRIVNDELKQEQHFARERKEIQEERMKLTSNSIEDETYLKTLKAEEEAVNTRAQAELAMLQRMSNRIERGSTYTGKDEEEILNTILDKYKDYYTKRAEQEKQYDDDIAELESQRTEENAARIDRAIAEAKRQRDEFLKVTEISPLLEQYATLGQKVEQINEQFKNQLALLKNDDGSLKEGVSEGNIQELMSQWEDALASLASDKNKAFEQMAEEVSNMALDVVLEQIEATEEALEQMSVEDGETYVQLQAKINALYERLKALNAQQRKADKGSTDDWKETNKVLTQATSVLNEAASAAGGVEGEFMKMSSTMVSSSLSIANALKGVSTAVSGLEKASAILTAIAAAVKVASIFASATKENKEANDAAAQSALSYAHALEEVEKSQALAKNETIFGSDSYSSFKVNITSAIENLKQYRDAINGVGNDSLTISNTMAKVAKAGAFGLFVKNSDLKNTKISANFIADQRSNWQKLVGSTKNIVTANLEDFYDEAGQLDAEKLRAFYEEYEDSLTAESKKSIEAILQEWDDVESAMDSIKSYLSSLFGDLGNDISDALVDAFVNGSDAAEAFGQSISAMIENMVEQMAYATFLQPIFAEMQDEIAAITKSNGSDEEKLEQMLDSLAQGMDNVLGIQGVYNDYLQAAKDAASERGFNIFSEDEADVSSSMSKGIATMSQDSADELNGRFTAIQGHTALLLEGLTSMGETQSMMLLRLISIESHTAQLDIMRDYLYKINNSMNIVVDKGVTML